MQNIHPSVYWPLLSAVCCCSSSPLKLLELTIHFYDEGFSLSLRFSWKGSVSNLSLCSFSNFPRPRATVLFSLPRSLQNLHSCSRLALTACSSCGIPAANDESARSKQLHDRVKPSSLLRLVQTYLCMSRQPIRTFAKSARCSTGNCRKNKLVSKSTLPQCDRVLRSAANNREKDLGEDDSTYPLKSILLIISSFAEHHKNSESNAQSEQLNDKSYFFYVDPTCHSLIRVEEVQ